MPDNQPNSRFRSPEGQTASDDKMTDINPPLRDAELVQLRVRVIALENIVIALLAQSSERQLELAREMAGHISPRPGFTTHPVTVHAAAEMNSLVKRASAFRSGDYLPRDAAQTE